MLKPIGAVCAAFAMSMSLPAVAQTTAPAVAAEPAAAAAAPAAAGTLIAVAKADPELSTFVKLATAANLDGTLAGQGPLTVLAPSNAAFAKLPAAQLADLENPENVATLQQVLMYHIIPGAAPSSAFKGTKGDVPSATPAKLMIDGTGATVTVNGAAVTRADVTATNGAIHVIDTVLTPPAASAAAAAPAAATPSTN
ncbi:MAG: fasciclin domain-containing protein [Sphingomonadaceae bacterium]|nr:fasciclin domain-containing protein [Sphingomonadaceae bacterium]